VIKVKYIFIGLIIAALVLLLEGIRLEKAKSPVVVDLKSRVEAMATEKRVPVIKVKRLEVKFVERAGRGGAGGLGAPVVETESPQQFFEIGKPKYILTTLRPETTAEYVEKEYWAVNGNENREVVVQFTERYYPPSGHYIERVEGNAMVCYSYHGDDVRALVWILFAVVAAGIFMWILDRGLSS